MGQPLTIAVVGLGKIGLPVAAQYASKGHRVVGADASPKVIESVNAGLSHILGEPLLAERVSEAVSAGLLRATTNTAAAVREAEVVVVLVPLLVSADGTADFRTIDAVTDEIGRSIRAGTLVLYETTVPLGTTRNRFGPALARRSGLRLTENLFLAFSPERVSSGQIFRDLATYPKIVGGVDPESTRRAAAFYSRVLDAPIKQVDEVETAEYSKLAETTYRFVNIALADELAIFGRERGVNVSQAFAAANSQPYSHIHQPGIGIGGHCIPVYPQFLLQGASNDQLSLIRKAKQVDEAMVDVYVRWLADVLGGLEGRRILILGVSYRPNVKETAFSTAFPLTEALTIIGAHPVVYDPLFSADELRALGFDPIDPTTDSATADAVVVQAFHREFEDLNWGSFNGLRAVIDARGALTSDSFVGTAVAFMSLGGATTARAAPGK